ncbi:unnamed protein product [Clavelina lepadiformis]|uniref:ShKT domain-containing protein n=1 Tax=Clavelina lepadiformis TaxID=159417 RepID=A0ABP0G0Y1_CLALP
MLYCPLHLPFMFSIHLDIIVKQWMAKNVTRFRIFKKVRLSGRKLQSVFLQARQGPDPLFDLIGSWSNLTSPEGHRLVTCGEASHSVGLYVSDGIANYTITFAWNGVCTKNTTFFLFALDAGNTTWQHIRVNCHNSLTISDNKEFSMWTKFGSCSVTCGKGLQIRTRKYHLERCDGPTEDVQICIKGSCPNVVCIDKFVNCKNWSRHCNGSFGLWIKVNCPQTCKICKSPQNVSDNLSPSQGDAHDIFYSF